MIRVVVADDHPIVRSGIVGLLRGASDIEVVGEARDGAEAVRLVAELAPELVLMDLRMPVLDGVAATAQIMDMQSGRVSTLRQAQDRPSSSNGTRSPGREPACSSSPRTRATSSSSARSRPAPAATCSRPPRRRRSSPGCGPSRRGETVLAPSIAAKLVQRVRADADRRSGIRGPALSPRELEVLRLVAAGQSNPRIAAALFIGEATVKTHLQHVFEKLEVSDRTRAVTRAMELGLL